VARTSGGVSLALAQVATTGDGGYALVDGTGTILSWTVPNDGNLHTALVAGTLIVTSAGTGGAIGTETTDTVLGNQTYPAAMYSSAASSGINQHAFCVGPGATVTVYQSSALTAGAAKVFVTIFGY